MTKRLRAVRALAEKEGLELVEKSVGKKHYQLILKNQAGQCMKATISIGGKDMGGGNDAANCQSNFRRFARGQTHGLILVNHPNSPQ